MLNQADHIATGRAVLDAVRDAGNRWIFPTLREEGLEPWNGVRQVWAAASPNSRHAVDTTDTFERGLASLRAHAAYLAGLGDGSFDPSEFLEGMARQIGSGLGVKYATSFEVYSIMSF
jgi:LmbE family N-acetylglucosaminyl deacetylase